MLLVALLVTLAPFRFAWPDNPLIGRVSVPQDMIYNILFFLPLGFIYRLTIFHGDDPWHLRALFLGTGLSAVIETAQLFLPGRVTSPSDVVANGLGMWAGSVLHDRVQARVDGLLLGRMTLELPLSILFYLLVPLMWINARAARLDPDRLWLAAILGVVGAIIVASLTIHRAGALSRASRGTAIITVGGWFLLGSIPAYFKRPMVVVLSGTITLAAATLFLYFPLLLRHRRDRRFEVPTLLRVAPVYLAYVVLLALWPWPDHWQTYQWLGYWGLGEMKDRPGDVAVLQLLEYVLSFAIIGYMVAESRGRRPESDRTSLVIVGGVCLVLACLLEIALGYHPRHSASFLRMVLVTGSGIFGGHMYRAQLATVRMILAR